MENKRESNYDFLRIICAIAVILLHGGGLYALAINGDRQADTPAVIQYICGVLPQFAVPCFVMLSGAFALADERNESVQYFYKKTFRKIGVPTLVFSVLYFFYSLALAFYTLTIQNHDWLIALFAPLEAIILGAPFYHMWYLYMMIGLYLLVPILHKIKRKLGGGVHSL